jgi:hypothetical protein
MTASFPGPDPIVRAALSLSLALAAACGAQAQDTSVARDTTAMPAAPSPDSTDARWGVSTRSWLDLQRSGRAAGKAHPVPGEIADLNWRRYVDSYKAAIPESFQSPLREAGAAR